MGSSKLDEDFRGKLISSVDETVKDLLGVGVVNAFNAHLAANGIERLDIPSKLDSFCSVLDETFGVAARTIQRGIAMRFYQKLGLAFELTNPSRLTEYVREAQRRMKDR